MTYEMYRLWRGVLVMVKVLSKLQFGSYKYHIP